MSISIFHKNIFHRITFLLEHLSEDLNFVEVKLSTAILYSFIQVLYKGNIVTLIQAYFERHVGPCKTKIDPDLGPNTVLISLFDILFRIHSFLILSPFHIDQPSLQTGLAVIYKIDFFS